MNNLRQFVQHYAPVAASAAQRLGVAPETLLGQWGLETGWGQSVPGAHNLGSIKDFSGTGAPARDNLTGSQDRYRMYDSPQAFGDDYVNLIARRYPNAMNAGGDTLKYARALKFGGYAQDPAYIRKVVETTGSVRKLGEFLANAISGTAHAEPVSFTEDNPYARFGPRIPVRSTKDEDNPYARFGPRIPVKPQSNGLINLADGFQHGVADDSIIGSAQTLGHGYSSTVNRIAPESDYAQAVTRSAAMQDQNIAQREQDYQARTKGSFMAGTGRFLGNAAGLVIPGTAVARVASLTPKIARLLGTAPKVAAVAQQIAGRAPMAQRMAGAAATGAGASLLQPVTQGDFWDEKKNQALMGGLFGAATAPVAAGVARMVYPKAVSNPHVQTLLKEGVTPTLGQIAGGIWRRVEDEATGIPGVGHLIDRARQGGNEAFNRAAYARALASIDQRPAQSVGQEAFKQTKAAFENAYQTLLPKLTFKADPPLKEALNAIEKEALDTLPATEVGQFQKFYQHHIRRKLIEPGETTGLAFKEVEHELTRRAGGYRKAASFDQQELGRLFSRINAALHESLQRANPKYAQQLKDVNFGYKQFNTLRKAAAHANTNLSEFTPAQLGAAVRANDHSVGHNAYAGGNVLMQDLSDAGKQVLRSETSLSSETARKILRGAGLAGGGAAALTGHFPPAVLGALAGASTLYSPIGLKLMAAALAKRPAWAKGVAQNLPLHAPAISAGVAPQIVRGQQ